MIKDYNKLLLCCLLFLICVVGCSSVNSEVELWKNPDYKLSGNEKYYIITDKSQEEVSSIVVRAATKVGLIDIFDSSSVIESLDQIDQSESEENIVFIVFKAIPDGIYNSVRYYNYFEISVFDYSTMALVATYSDESRVYGSMGINFSNIYNTSVSVMKALLSDLNEHGESNE